MKKPFWQTKTLTEMSDQEWESICDGCAKCCLQQLEDEQTNQLVFTDVACDFLDPNSCRCKQYQRRSSLVPTCLTITPENIEQVVEFAPPTCAYRLLYENKPLPVWHHLVSGSLDTIHQTGNSVQGRVRFMGDQSPENLEEYVVEWPLN
jgi:uncharacterized cysteine cluster protein YcgN (CxxCxxCC family)